MFLDLLDAAERAPRSISSFRTGHAVGDELVFEQLEVRADLAIELGFGVTRAK